MSEGPSTVLVVGPTKSVGRLVVDELIRAGYAVRALVRDLDRARRLPAEAERAAGDFTKPATLPAAVAGVDAIVFTHGSDGAGKLGAESIDYGGVRNVLAALGGHTARIALMTAIGVTDRTGAYNRAAILKPMVVRAVDLDQFSQTVAPVARLVDRRVAWLAAAPEIGLQEPLAQGLARQYEAMQFPPASRRARSGRTPGSAPVPTRGPTS
jgi:hypothetical protein